MSNVKISELPAATTPLVGTELLEIVQSGTNKKVAASDLGGSSYLVYTALLTQSGSNPPVATILENTLGGTPIYSRTTDGVYAIQLVGAWTANKTWVMITNNSALASQFYIYAN